MILNVNQNLAGVIQIETAMKEVTAVTISAKHFNVMEDVTLRKIALELKDKTFNVVMDNVSL